MSLRTKLVLAFAIPVAVRLAFYLYTGFVADDAFITFRYAENLARGLGFVYNSGEQVLGTSTPFFTWILALLASCRFPVIWGALLVSLICSGLTGAVLLQFARNLRFGRFAWLPVLVYALWPRSVPADISGMETALFTLLVAAAFYYHQRRQDYYAIGLATLATLTRPEGALLLVIILVDSCYRKRHLWKSYLATPAVLLGPYLLFAFFYFGSGLPHSIEAKLALYSRFGAGSWWQNLVYLMGWHNPVGWIMTVLAVIGARWLNRKQNFGIVETVWLVGMIGFYTMSRTHLFFWYIVPVYPIYILLATAAVVEAVDRFKRLRESWVSWQAVIAIVVSLVLLVGLYRQAVHYRREQAYAEDVLQEVGLYLARYVNRETDLIAAEDIGYIGYYSGCRILDRDGLVSPVALKYNREAKYLELILEQQPDWVGVRRDSPISGFIDSSAFLEKYEFQIAFGSVTPDRYEVYGRIK